MIEQLIKKVDILSVFTRCKDPLDIRFGDILKQYSDNTEISKNTIAILGVPQDLGIIRNGGRPGAALGPEAIRKALYKLTVHGLSKQLDHIDIIDIGDIDCEGETLESIREKHYAIAREILESGAKLLVIGGGHDCAYPHAKALNSLSESISVINVDPHLDVRDLIEGKAHSGSPFREIQTELSPAFLHEFGIQEFSVSTHHVEYAQQCSIGISWYADLRCRNSINQDFLEIMLLAKRSSNNVFVSFDTDSISSAFAPGVSAPAAIGFTSDEILGMSYVAASNHATVIDFVEMNPQYDQDGRTAKIIALSIAMAIKGWLE
jgi:formimidoylglutamase